jgi:hypothetical protein
MRCLAAAALLVGCYEPRTPAGVVCPDGHCPTGFVCVASTQTCEREGTGGPGMDAAVDAAVDARTSAYAYRRRITIQNGAAALPAGYTIRVVLGPTLGALVADGKVKADLGDLRLIGDGVIGERDRIVDPVAGPAPPAVSFSLQAPIAAGATSNEYALYYGAPDKVAAPAQGSAVFALYDDFENGIGSVWSRNDGPTAVGGKLVLRAGRSDALTTNAANDGVPVISAVELVARVVNPNSGPADGYWFGYQRTGDFVTQPPWVLWIARGQGVVRPEQASPNGCGNICVGATKAQDALAHYYAIERDPNATRFYLDGALSFTASLSGQVDYSVQIRNFLAASALEVDWVRARARVTPDPTVVLGAEESL